MLLLMGMSENNWPEILRSNIHQFIFLKSTIKISELLSVLRIFVVIYWFNLTHYIYVFTLPKYITYRFSKAISHNNHFRVTSDHRRPSSSGYFHIYLHYPQYSRFTVSCSYSNFCQTF